jgi:hypothetical protein
MTRKRKRRQRPQKNPILSKNPQPQNREGTKWVIGNSVGHRVDRRPVPNLADALGFLCGWKRRAVTLPHFHGIAS